MYLFAMIFLTIKIVDNNNQVKAFVQKKYIMFELQLINLMFYDTVTSFIITLSHPNHAFL